jgi:hypothetical protein
MSTSTFIKWQQPLSPLHGSDSTTELSTDLNCRFPLFLVVHALQEGNVPELDPIVMACTKIMCLNLKLYSKPFSFVFPFN